MDIIKESLNGVGSYNHKYNFLVKIAKEPVSKKRFEIRNKT